MSLKYSLHTGCTFQLVSLFAEKNPLLLLFCWLFISGWKESKQQKGSEPFISLQMRFTIRDSVTGSQGEWIISFDDFVAQVRSWPSKPHTCYANLGDQSSYPVTALICASIFPSTKLDGNKWLEMVCFRVEAAKLGFTLLLYMYHLFMYFVTESGVKCVFPSKPVLVHFKMLRLRQPWRTETTTSVDSSQLKGVISLQSYLLYLLNSWVAMLFGNSSPVFHYISWTNPSNVLNVSWYFEWFFCQPSTALQLFWSICKVTHMTDVAPAIGCLCLSDWRTPTHPRLLLAIEKDLCQWLHMSFSGEIYNHINILISFWMSLLRERWSSRRCAALSSAHRRLRVLQKRKITRLCHWGSKPCSCSTKRCINAPCWVSNDSSKSELVWYPIVMFWYAKCQGDVSRSLSRKYKKVPSCIILRVLILFDKILRLGWLNTIHGICSTCALNSFAVFARWMNCKTPTQAILVKPQQKSNGFRIPRWKKSSFLVGNVDVTFFVFFWGLKACRGLNRRQHPVDAQGMGGRYHAICRRIFLSDFAPFQKRCPKLWCWCISWIAKLLPSMNRSVSFSEKVAKKGCSGLPPQWAVYLHTDFFWLFCLRCWCCFFSPERFWESIPEKISCSHQVSPISPILEDPQAEGNPDEDSSIKKS